MLSFLLAALSFNPIALPVIFGMLGTQFTTAYFLTVSIGPAIAGILFNTFARNNLKTLPIAGGSQVAEVIELEEFEDEGFLARVKSGLVYAFGDLLVSMSPWIMLGMILAGLSSALITVAPESMVMQYFADPGITPLLVAAAIATVFHI